MYIIIKLVDNKETLFIKKRFSEELERIDAIKSIIDENIDSFKYFVNVSEVYYIFKRKGWTLCKDLKKIKYNIVDITFNMTTISNIKIFSYNLMQLFNYPFASKEDNKRQFELEFKKIIKKFPKEGVTK